MIRTLGASFRFPTTGGAHYDWSFLNLVDAQPGNFGSPSSVWTTGATLIDPLVLSPLPNERWTILAYSVTGYLGLTATADPLNTYRAFGKLGKIIAALIPDINSYQVGPGQSPMIQPMEQLPIDATLSVDFWNPAVDPLPPVDLNQWSKNPTIAMPVSCTLNLPQPREITQGTQMGIGLWMMPSLVPVRVLIGPVSEFPSRYVFQAKYTVIYDDGH